MTIGDYIMTKKTAVKNTPSAKRGSLSGDHFTLEQVAHECIGFQTESEALKDKKGTLSDHFMDAAKMYITKKPKDGEEMATSFAGIDVLKKGMDFAQCYGSSSSYAKKYAMCSLFAIDDSELDPDAKEPQNEQKTTGMGNPEKNKIIRQLKTKYDIRKHANYNIEIDGKTFQFHQIMNRITNAPMLLHLQAGVRHTSQPDHHTYIIDLR